MKRSPPPQRKTRLARGKRLEPGSSRLARSGPPAARSAKMTAFMRQIRRPLTEKMLAESPWCEVCPLLLDTPTVGPILRRFGLDHPHHADALHELRKSGQGGSKTNRANLRRACNLGNGLIEDYPNEAHAVGLVVRRGDPGHADLSATLNPEGPPT